MQKIDHSKKKKIEAPNSCPKNEGRFIQFNNFLIQEIYCQKM